MATTNNVSFAMNTTMATVDPCLFMDQAGFEYQEFSCLYPSITPFTFQFEINYDPNPYINYMFQNDWIPWVTVSLYGTFIYLGREYFRDREPLNLRATMAIWNLALSLFSLIGTLKVFPHLVHYLVTMSTRDIFCNDPRTSYGCGSTGFWVAIFCFSKFPELFDTFFIVVHKKKLIFLHWYHHITVLLFCWYSYKLASPPSIFFVAMNFCVHAIMYGYYFLTTQKLVPKWFNPMIITTMQISQMWIGVIVTALGFYFYSLRDETCAISYDNMKAGFIMYGSYLFLFSQFFIGRYIRPKITIHPRSNIKTA